MSMEQRYLNYFLITLIKIYKYVLSLLCWKEGGRGKVVGDKSRIMIWF